MSYASLHYHLVFATKERRPLIRDDWRPRLHEYLGGIVRGLGGFPEVAGGVADHVHLLVGLKPTHRLSDVLREVKSESSRWVHADLGERGFQWQDGYAAFTVSASSRDGVRAYIANQQEHHRTRTSREELAQLLTKAGIEYDERYFV